ncbi:P-loop containing nucleoside triphosphate hydrolase protein [Cyathus striatus]|nr:P-loop containing nucleoside triphosphate hydrolase protein [Cyathus striatus]
MSTIPSIANIRSKTLATFGICPCLWQISMVQAILKHNCDVISIAGTGLGKMLSFWMPLIFCLDNDILIIITPLNILGKQHTESLSKAGKKGIFIGRDTATAANFQAIENFEYQVIVVSPEQLVKSHIICIVVDEVHCVYIWSAFRPEYNELGHLQDILPKEIPILVTSATLPKHILNKSTQCSNIFLGIQKILSPLLKFEDLKFILNNWKVGDPPPPKFLVFFDDINESIAAREYLCSQIPPAYHEKIIWFNADMSDDFKEDELIQFVLREWTYQILSWWFSGRAAHNRTLTVKAVFLVEREYFDNEHKCKAEK